MTPHEARRLAALERYRVLEGGPDPRLDRLVALAADLFETPIALASLIDETRQWFQSSLGVSVVEVPRYWSLCAHAIQSGQPVFVVPDASLDPRFESHPLVTGPAKLRFYAGAPLLTSDGEALGALCVVDTCARPYPDAGSLRRLRHLADLVMDELDLRLASHMAEERARLLQMAGSLSGLGHWRLNAADRRLDWSEEVYRLHGVQPEAFRPTYDAAMAFCPPDQRTLLSEHIERAIETQAGFTLQLKIQRAEGSTRDVVCKAECELDEAGRTQAVFGVFQDISETVAAMEAIRANEVEHRLLTENATDVITRYGVDGTFSYISPAVTAVLGYAPKELIGRTTFEVIDPDDHARVIGQFQALVAGKDTVAATRIEYRATCKDGTVVWLEAHPRPLHDSRGRVIGFQDVVRDVTTRRAMESALRVSEARFRTLAETSQDIITFMQPTGEIDFVSPAVGPMLGYSPEEVIGRNAASLLHPDNHPGARHAFRAALRRGGGVRSEYRLQHKDGGAVWAESCPTAVIDPATGAMTGITDILRDISGRKAAEAALSESEARYRLLTDNAGDIVTQCDIEGRFVYVSPALEKITGFTSDEVVGRPAIEFVHPDDRAQVAKDIASALNAVDGIEIEHRHVTKDGRTIWIQSHPRLARDSVTGRAFAITDVMRDVTDRRALQQALQEAQTEAEVAAAVKSEFLSNMSHELRTPLTSILGFSAILRSDGTLGDRSRRAIERINSAGQALLTLVNDILDFSKLEAGQVEITLQTVTTTAFLRGALELLEPQAQQKGLTLRFKSRGDLPAALRIDPDRVRQVLLNLLSNAVKFTPEGSVTLHAAYDPERALLRCEVADTGPGIAAESRDRLFKRFSQVDGSSTRAHGGTGLGLAICKGLVETMGGKIGLDETRGPGSRFWFEIPNEADLGPGSDEAPEVGMILRGRHLLVADDNPINLELLRLMLEPLGARLTFVVSGEAARDAAGAQAFDLVIMDLNMPGLGGAAAALQIRNGPGPNQTTPILAFSTSGNLEGVRRSDLFADTLAKPIVAASLVEKTTHWSSRRL